MLQNNELLTGILDVVISVVLPPPEYRIVIFLNQGNTCCCMCFMSQALSAWARQEERDTDFKDSENNVRICFHVPYVFFPFFFFFLFLLFDSFTGSGHEFFWFCFLLQKTLV